MRRIPVLLLLAVAAVIGLAGPAMAHTELIETSPADGATAAVGGRAVTLTFTQEVDHRLASVTVSRRNGDVVSTGEPQRDGVTLVQPVPALTGGRYDVQWRAAAADGHILKGTFSFGVDAEGATAPPAETSERLSPADLLREHAKGNYDHDSPSYAISAPEPASDADAASAAEPASVPQEPTPPRNTAPVIVGLLAAGLGVTLVTAGVESIRASRV